VHDELKILGNDHSSWPFSKPDLKMIALPNADTILI